MCAVGVEAVVIVSALLCRKIFRAIGHANKKGSRSCLFEAKRQN
jgi:hypothetical protein